MLASPVVELRQVSYVYPNGLQALASVDLRIERGEFVSIIGPSGCGKSTILRLVAGLLEPSPDSHVQTCPDDNAEHSLACVFQTPTLMPWASVERNVRLPLELSASAESAERVDRALRLVGLEAFRHAYPRELSGGMQMRVSIARALATQPRLLLMDEPFAALDEITRNRLDSDLRNLWAAEKLTTLFITHSIYEAVFLSTRIVVMSSRPGRIVGEVLIDKPMSSNEYAATPRNDDFRTSEKFIRCCAEASRLLRAGSSEGVAT